MNTPYLIQRLIFKKSARTNKGSFDDVLGCDYMGSSEFEFGALPKSLKRIAKGFDELALNIYSSLKNHKGQKLTIIAKKSVSEYYYSHYMVDLASGKMRLKEQSRFNQAISGKDWRGKQIDDYFKVDAWWDIDNDVIFTFGKKNAKKILKAIENTRNKKKSEGVDGWY